MSIPNGFVPQSEPHVIESLGIAFITEVHYLHKNKLEIRWVPFKQQAAA